MHTSDLFHPLNCVYDSDNSEYLQPFYSLHSSENFQNLDDKSAGNFQPSTYSDLCEFTYYFLARKCDFVVGNCLGQ